MLKCSGEIETVWSDVVRCVDVVVGVPWTCAWFLTFLPPPEVGGPGGSVENRTGEMGGRGRRGRRPEVDVGRYMVLGVGGGRERAEIARPEEGAVVVYVGNVLCFNSNNVCAKVLCVCVCVVANEVAGARWWGGGARRVWCLSTKGVG